ncbi:helix-turn-helix domain-containing protein [Erwinia sp. HDF1-3R]|uniref:helix-turn-helix domain-containing protein n=1 Tax=Erwinia sp. HDF1-3R TaxID=3141543 RepID=UPI0031F57F5B
MLEINLENKAFICKYGLSTSLTNKELALLLIFIDNKSTCLTHELITSALWDKKCNLEDNLFQLIFSLRKKLKKIGVFDLISNVRGVGYIFDKNDLFSIIKNSPRDLTIIYNKNLSDSEDNTKIGFFYLNKLFDMLCRLFLKNKAENNIYKKCESPDIQLKIIELCEKLGF